MTVTRRVAGLCLVSLSATFCLFLGSPTARADEPSEKGKAAATDKADNKETPKAEYALGGGQRVVRQP